MTPILYVHHRPELGGAAGALSRLIAALDRDRFRPHVFTPDGPAAEQFAAAGAIVHPGPTAAFTHIWASSYDGLRWLLVGREAARLPGHLRELSRVLRTERFGLVHLNDSPLLPAARVACRQSLPVVFHLRSALPEGGRDRRSVAVQRQIASIASVSVAVNEDVAASFPLVQSDVVFDPVDLDRFRPGDAHEARAALGFPQDLPVVSFLGYLYPAKGFRELIGAAAILQRNGIEATWVIAGGGVRPATFYGTLHGRALARLGAARDHEQEARSLVAELGLVDRFRFLPFTAETPVVLRASDVVALPSQGPELGLPALEAAASGVPVVATGSRTGAGVVVPDETGVVTPDASAEALADALRGLLTDPDRRSALGRAARAHAEQRFDARLSVDRIEALYARLLALPSPA